MREFNIHVENRIGSLADVLEVIAKANVNVEAIATEDRGSKGVIKLIVSDENLARQVLTASGIEFHEHEVASIKLRDKPGEFAKVSRAIANLGVDIKSVFLLDKKDGRTEVVVRVDNLAEIKNLFK